MDYSTFGMGIQQGKEWSWIEGGVGPHWAPAGLREELLKTAAELSIRSYRAGTWSGFDIKGRSATGEYWRYLGWVGQGVNYRVASKDVATALDDIIDGMKVKRIQCSDAEGAGSARADCPQMGRVLGGTRWPQPELHSLRAKCVIFEGSEFQGSLAKQLH